MGSDLPQWARATRICLSVGSAGRSGRASARASEAMVRAGRPATRPATISTLAPHTGTSHTHVDNSAALHSAPSLLTGFGFGMSLCRCQHHVCPLPRAPAGLPHLVSEHKGFARESKLMQQTTLEHEDAPAAQQGSGADAAADAAAASSVAAGPPVSQSPVKPRHLRVHIGQMRLERTPSSWTMKQTRLQLHGPASDDPQSHSVSASALQLDLLESHLPHAWGMWPTQWVVRDLAGPDPNATVAQMRWAGVAESIKASVDKKAYVHIAPEYEKHASFVLMALMQSYLNNIRA